MPPQAIYLSAIRLLIENKADLNAVSSTGDTRFTALMEASARGLHSAVKSPIELRADVNAAANGGETALMRAAFRNHEPTVRLLLEHKADSNAVNKKGETAFGKAKCAGHQSIVRLILETALDRAAFCDEASVRMLLDCGADVNAALRYSAFEGHEQLCACFLSISLT
jgi:ankyrin repeat protein